YDIEIVETHHRNKVDSPSGTAIGLGKAVANGLGVDFNEKAIFERYGDIGKREAGTIGIQTLRGGDVVGDHTVLFLGDGERIELTHKATSRNNFSTGVLKAVKWLPGKSAGIYSMKDVLDF
ncbi:MAG: 4-hydroxy-tetrahydrodipicolinate reductase, partial [Candidatus Dadabacteria bacterium]|nr:4-hydroxy-tetrahydrodipicolinate reductase [Candidatus Dadabacteria bacterium]NIQ17118.1 4-hydroxy-tetrahydrodipicolinate reductase [Candidatus Dadabacteria bacterium]